MNPSIKIFFFQEYLKEKKKKKQEKMQEQIESKEKEKKQWQNFSSKAFGKKGFVKKSIFKTPESSDGKVIYIFCLGVLFE